MKSMRVLLQSGMKNVSSARIGRVVRMFFSYWSLWIITSKMATEVNPFESQHNLIEVPSELQACTAASGQEREIDQTASQPVLQAYG